MSISFIYIYIFGFLVVVGFMQSVTLHTNVGELKCEIFCDEVPKTAEVCVSLHSPSSSVSISNSFFLSLYLMRPQQQAVI